MTVMVRGTLPSGEVDLEPHDSRYQICGARGLTSIADPKVLVLTGTLGQIDDQSQVGPPTPLILAALAWPLR